MAERITIARPYAKAAFELARGQDALGAWSQRLACAAALASDPQLRGALGDPRVERTRLVALFVELCAPAGDALWERFLGMLAENRRLALLPEVAMLYEQLRAEAERTLEAEVVAAIDLSAEERSRLAAALSQRLGRGVSLRCRTDPDLLAGLIVRAGDLVIDGSVRGRLAQLAEALRS